MKTKLLGTICKGSASVDPRFSAAMLKWIIADIRNRDSSTKLSIGIEGGVLETYNIDFELQFKHQIKHIIGMCLITTQKVDQKNATNLMQILGSKNGFIYLLKIPIDPLLHIYLYECDSLIDITSLLESIQNYIQMSHDNTGKIPKAIIPKAADTNDDSIKQILGRNGIQTTPASNLKLSLSIKQFGSANGNNSGFDCKPRISASKSFTSGFNQCYKEVNIMNSSPTSTNLQFHANESPQNHFQYFEVKFVRKIDLNDKIIAKDAIDEFLINFSTNEMNIDEQQQQQPSTSSAAAANDHIKDDENFEKNRMMVLMIGQDFRLISPDHKKTLLCKTFSDILNCERGLKFSDHFVLTYRSHKNYDRFIGYFFKCQSKSIVDDIVSGITLMMIRKKKENYQVIACESCPMLWYHNLCIELDNLNDKKTNTVIRNYIDKLSIDEQNIIMTKYNGADDNSKNGIAEQNQFFMMLLRAHCEYKNERHIHDVEGNKHFFTEPLNSKTFFMKAKRSLTSSFDHLLKRKSNNKDDIKVIVTTPNNPNDICLEEKLLTSQELSSSSQFNKSPQSYKRILSSPSTSSSSLSSFNNNNNQHQQHHTPLTKSWRQEIFNRVSTPSKNFNKSLHEAYFSPRQSLSQKKKNQNHRTSEEIRLLWQTAIRQIILLSRMEKENDQLQAKQNENEIKRIKLEYDDITGCDKNSNENWDELIREKNQNRLVLLQAIKNGVPRYKRGEVWLYLKEIYSSNDFNVNEEKFPNYHSTYKDLLKSFTEHQHAIFIDLGRTFPNHKFYKQSLGVGQLSLFNLLKAYSILDPELGYCQGLGFICGILLLHLDENEAFNMLKYLMFERQLRLKYLPEMKQFQLQLYQLSRLIKDYLPDLYDWLEKKDISTTLYAAPWILTIFSSQFSLGFVTRVFDLLFLESSEIIFKVSLALLIIHKNQLLRLESFEDIVGYIKNVITKVDSSIMERVLKIVFTSNITVLLNEYQIEYNVLQEEINLQNQQMDILEKTKEENQNLVRQLENAQTCIKQLEERNLFKITYTNELELKLKNQDVTIAMLKNFINLLIEYNKNNNNNDDDSNAKIDIKNLISEFNNINKLNNLNFLNIIEHLLKFNDGLSNDTILLLEKSRENFNFKLDNENDNDSGVSTPMSPESSCINSDKCDFILS